MLCSYCYVSSVLIMCALFLLVCMLWSVLIVMYALFLLLCMLCCVYSVFIVQTGTPATLTEVFPCFFLSCKANARV